ncbi:MAG: histidine phosphatase family protein [Eisenbergiella massiliensis]
MRIIFVRHAEPDYANDTLTEKGWREAALLAERVSGWDVTDFYVSPLGRARDTASLSLKKMGRTAETFDWLREFLALLTIPPEGKM